MAEFLYRLGSTAARRAWRFVAAWVVVLLVAAVAFVVAGGTLTDSFSIPGTPTQQVTDQLAEEIPAAAGATAPVVLSTDDGSAFTTEQQAAISGVIADVEAVDGVETVVDPFETQATRAAQGQQLAEGQMQLDDGTEQIAAGQTQLEEAAAQLDASQAQLDAARQDGAPAAGLDAQQAQIDAGRDELSKQQDTLDAQAAQLEAAGAQLEQGQALAELASGITTVSEDGSAAVATVVLTGSALDVSQETKDAVIETFTDGVSEIDGVSVDFSAALANEPPEVVGPGEVIGLVVAAIVLFVMLGTLIGAGLPLLTALVGVGIGALGALSLSGVVAMSSVTPILGLMLGLAVGIDYALFIVNRHRIQLKHGYAVRQSIALATGTSGNAVVFAGTTVVIALLALNVTGIPFLGMMGSVGAASVAIAVLVAVTLTPALLSLIGPRILNRKERAALSAHGAVAVPGEVPSAGTATAKPVRPMSTWSAVGRVVIGVVALLIVAIPSLSLRINLPDGSTDAPDSTTYQAYSTVAEKFGPGVNGPLLVVAVVPEAPSEQELLGVQLDIAQQIAEHDDVVAVAPAATSEDRTVLAFQVIPADGPTTESTEQLVNDLRDSSPLEDGTTLGVAGAASGNIDISAKLSDALPLYLGVVVGLSMIILIIVFRSLFVPVIATLGFILSYFAAIGGVVAIYQWGWLDQIFGVDNPGPILNFLPTILLGILFGLAMDYQLFLGSGMREAYAHGAPARLAVAQGFRAGRSVVTAAAIIMIAVFGGFIFSDSAMIRPIGFALAFGILVDAFLVRMLIIPALMHLVGDGAWWLPRWLDRFVPDVDIEGAKLEREHPSDGREPAAAAAGREAEPVG
jgi:putative drug exporter of the RND superfamily